ncbi:MAG: hypothetical protein PHT07_23985 [Paludibacter sp.]|nr:hypothetical protein [Paludibacter sp.]
MRNTDFILIAIGFYLGFYAARIIDFFRKLKNAEKETLNGTTDHNINSK